MYVNHIVLTTSKWMVSSRKITAGLNGGVTFFSWRSVQLILVKKGCLMSLSTPSGPGMGKESDMICQGCQGTAYHQAQSYHHLTRVTGEKKR